MFKAQVFRLWALVLIAMVDDSQDRYGYRHRNDQDHDVGDSKVGDIGDSKGTIHDRARRNNNIVVDGEVRSTESYKRTFAEVESQNTDSGSQSSSESKQSTSKISQSEADGQVVTLTIDSNGGTFDTIAHYKNHQVHLKGGRPGETVRVRLESAPGYMIGRRIEIQD